MKYEKFYAASSALIVSSLALSGPLKAKEFEWRAVSDETGKVEYKNGVPVITRDKGDYFVMVAPFREDWSGGPMIALIIGNRNKEPFTVGVEDLSISFTGDRSGAKFLTQNDLISRIKNKAGWSAFATGLFGGSTQSRTTVTTPYGNYSARTTNPAEDYSRIDQSAATAIDAIRKNTMETTTVNPKTYYKTIAVMEKVSVKKYPSRVTFTIKAADFEETFLLDLRR